MSLVVQRLRLCTPNGGGLGFIRDLDPTCNNKIKDPAHHS